MDDATISASAIGMLTIVTALGIAMATLVSIGVARHAQAVELLRADTRRPDTRLG